MYNVLCPVQIKGEKVPSRNLVFLAGDTRFCCVTNSRGAKLSRKSLHEEVMMTKRTVLSPKQMGLGRADSRAVEK